MEENYPKIVESNEPHHIPHEHTGKGKNCTKTFDHTLCPCPEILLYPKVSYQKMRPGNTSNGHRSQPEDSTSQTSNNLNIKTNDSSGLWPLSKDPFWVHTDNGWIGWGRKNATNKWRKNDGIRKSPFETMTDSGRVLMSDKEGVPCTFVVSLLAVDNRKDSHLVGKPGKLLFTHDEGPTAGPPFWQHLLRGT